MYVQGVRNSISYSWILFGIIREDKFFTLINGRFLINSPFLPGSLIKLARLALNRFSKFAVFEIVSFRIKCLDKLCIHRDINSRLVILSFKLLLYFFHAYILWCFKKRKKEKREIVLFISFLRVYFRIQIRLFVEEMYLVWRDSISVASFPFIDRYILEKIPMLIISNIRKKKKRPNFVIFIFGGLPSCVRRN